MLTIAGGILIAVLVLVLLPLVFGFLWAILRGAAGLLSIGIAVCIALAVFAFAALGIMLALEPIAGEMAGPIALLGIFAAPVVFAVWEVASDLCTKRDTSRTTARQTR